MSQWELQSRAESISRPAMQMKKLSKKATGESGFRSLSHEKADSMSKQTAEQSAENDNQLLVQSSISFKMSKQLIQFFVSEFNKTSDSFKIKLEALMFEPGSGHEANPENEDETSDEIKEVLEIIK